MRRFGQVIGQCEALTPAQTVGGAKPHKGRSPTAVLRNPEAAEWRRNAYSPVMRSGAVHHLLNTFSVSTITAVEQ
jgi:hypothetical protein